MVRPFLVILCQPSFPQSRGLPVSEGGCDCINSQPCFFYHDTGKRNCILEEFHVVTGAVINEDE